MRRHSPGARRITLGADKGYGAAVFVTDMRELNVTPHIAQNISGRRSAIDARTTRHDGYVVSQQKKKHIDESFGWGKTIGGLARPMLRGAKKLGVARAARPAPRHATGRDAAVCGASAPRPVAQ